MPVLEKLLSVVAPHECLICEAEGGLICAACRPDALHRVPSRCFRCHKLTKKYRVCSSCRSSSKLLAVWVASDYTAVSKELVYRLKFARARAAADDIAGFLAELLPLPPHGYIVVPVPTASSRRRQRGYDQAELIARTYATLSGARFMKVLHRQGQTRQVGTHRRERLQQLETAFWVDADLPKHAKVLLVDDVTTTGATLEAAANVLRANGAFRIQALVFSQA